MGRRTSLLFILLSIPLIGRGQVVINEIMYAPLSPEPEWIELLNAGSAPLSTDGWTVQDAAGGVGALPAIVIPGKGYALLTRDSARLLRVRPVAAPIAQLALPTLNNGGDLVALRDRRGRLVDSVHYASSWGGTGGVSLERRLASDPGIDRRSWGSSTSPARATAGALNAITPVDHDLALMRGAFDLATSHVRLRAANNGLQPAPSAELRLAFDRDGDGEIQEEEILSRIDLPALAVGDTVEIIMIWPRALTEEGEPGLVEVSWPADERSENDLLSFVASSVPLTGGVIVNEIMYDPVPLDGAPGAEYVELYNPSRRHVSVAEWRLYDGTGKEQGVVHEEAAIEPLGFLVLATDSAIYRRFPWLSDSTNVLIIGPSSFALNVEGDHVVIISPSGETVDSVPYLDSWHRSDMSTTKGISLERVSPTAPSADSRNWSSAVAQAGGTPGAPNSIAVAPTVSAATIDVGRGVVSPDADGFEDFLRISFRLAISLSRLVVTIYDRDGNGMRRLATNDLVGVEGELVWDGYGDDGRPLAPGIYVVHLEAYDVDRGGTVAADAPVVVARRFGR